MKSRGPIVDTLIFFGILIYVAVIELPKIAVKSLIRTKRKVAYKNK
jgi:hypothetical protein